MKRTLLVLTALIGLIIGCASAPMKVSTPPINYATRCEELEEGEGSAGGFLFLHLIPMGSNERLVQAYEKAVNSKGGTHLVNPEIKDYWYYAYIGQIKITTVKGKVIKCP